MLKIRFLRKEYNYIFYFKDTEFHEVIYPNRIFIYEIYHPGDVIKIWARDPNNQWFLLWHKLSQHTLPQESKLFSSLLQLCNFKTKMLRLEFRFCNSWLAYYTKMLLYIDAVLLNRTLELVLSKKLFSKKHFIVL